LFSGQGFDEIVERGYLQSDASYVETLFLRLCRDFRMESVDRTVVLVRKSNDNG